MTRTQASTPISDDATHGAERHDGNRDDPVRRFEAANSPEGRLVRYAEGRVRHFLARQVLTLTGAGVLGLLVAPSLGAATLVLALLGEAVDCMVLRAIAARLRAGDGDGGGGGGGDGGAGSVGGRGGAGGGGGGRLANRLAIATAAFQSLTIGACVAAAWAAGPQGAGTFFALSFLTGAALNAGATLPIHPGTARTRLAVLGLAALGLLAGEASRIGMASGAFGFVAAGMGVTALVVQQFLAFVTRHHDRQRGRERALLRSRSEAQATARELAAREREARLLSLVARHARDSVLITDADRRILWVNDAFTRITGYSREAALGQHPGALLNAPETDPDILAKMARRLAEGRPFRGQLVNRTRDGRRIWIDTHIVPVPDPVPDSGAGRTAAAFVSVERDITRERVAQARLAEALRRAQEAERAKSEFLATISHEIRTPMNAVIGMTDVLAETSLDDDQRLYCETIRSSAAALLTLIDDVLELSRVEAGAVVLHPAPFDLHRSLAVVAEVLRSLVGSRPVSVALEIGPGVPRFIKADEGRLRQILLNLGGNAVKFTPEGSVTVRALCPARGRLTVEVVDTGIGIPPDRLEHIFDRFVQADGSISRRFGGTGLGLAISRELAGMMGGAIRAASRPGRGSTFTLDIAFEEATGEVRPAGERARARRRPPAIRPGLRILVADDNRTNRLLVERMLRDAPVSLAMAADGREAVSKVETFMPDVVLMDMAMPDLDGIEATRRIRRLPVPQPTIIALTANAFEEHRSACLAAGMDGYLVKPLRKANLLDCIGKLPDRGPRQRRAGSVGCLPDQAATGPEGSAGRAGSGCHADTPSESPDTGNRAPPDADPPAKAPPPGAARITEPP